MIIHRRRFLIGASAAAVTAGLSTLAAAQSLIPQLDRVPRVAFGGIAAENSSYSNLRSNLASFRILRGQELTDDPQYAFLKRYEIPFLPVLAASPRFGGGIIEKAAYDTIKAEFLERLTALLPLDGLYLPMHGAMFVEGMEDVEGDWYTAAREVVGPDCLMVASYDLHGNVSQRIVDTLDGMTAYRTAPHVDRVENTMRATYMLTHCLRYNLRPAITWASIPICLPGEQTSTEWEPGRRLWSDLSEYNRFPNILDVSQLVGYVWADEPRSAATVVVTGFDPAMQSGIATELAQRYWDARDEFQFESPTGTIEETIAMALATTTQPVVISDSGDNPGGGGNSDQTFFLQALLDAEVTNVLLGGMTDLPAVQACYEAGVGATIPLSIGATLDPRMCDPVQVPAAKVVYLAPADDMRLGQAVVEFDGITATLSGHRRNYHAAEAFTELGLDPTAFKIVVVKCGYLNPTMKPLANPALMALSPGAIDQDIVNIANDRRGSKWPWVPDIAYTPQPYLSARARNTA